MYVPTHFASNDEDLARRLIKAYGFGILMTSRGYPGADVEITHLPMLLDDTDDAAIIGHVARANAHWQSFDGKTPAVAVFGGPHAYISPNWYANLGLVPTWNYAAVHVHGRPRALDVAAAEDVLRKLVAAFESDATGNWSVDDLPDGALPRQLKGIVAFEMPVERMEVKVKMSQNRSAADVAGAIAGLRQGTDADALATADMMAALNSGTGS